MNKHGQWCYTYLLGWRSLDMWYYGYRGANKLPPLDDLPIYLSSSEHVDAFIDLNGPPDVIRVHKLFHTKDEAKAYETRFIKRVNAVRSERWLNKHDGGPNWGVARFFSEEHKRKISEAKMGHLVSFDSRQKMSEKRKAYMATEEGKAHLQKMIDSRDGAWNKGVAASDETKQKISETINAKYADGYVSPLKGRKKPKEMIEKMAAAKRGKAQSDEHRKKNSEAVKAAWARRKAQAQ